MKRYDIKRRHTSTKLLNKGLVLWLSTLLFATTCHGALTETNVFTSKHHDFSVKTIVNNLDNPWGLLF